MKWFEGVWSRFKPEIGKDRRGMTGVEKNEIIKIGKKLVKFQKILIFIKL